MNEKPSPSRWDDAQAAPEALGALLARFPAYAFESECQRSLDMIVLCQRYISRLVEEQNGPQADELRQSLSDLAVAANRLDRNLSSLTSLLRSRPRPPYGSRSSCAPWPAPSVRKRPCCKRICASVSPWTAAACRS